jgi:hypothetical protein
MLPVPVPVTLARQWKWLRLERVCLLQTALGAEADKIAEVQRFSVSAVYMSYYTVSV